MATLSDPSEAGKHFREFIDFCVENKISEAKRLYALGSIDIHQNNDFSFRISCKNGSFDVVKWLYSLGGIDIRVLSLSNHPKQYTDSNGHNVMTFDRIPSYEKGILDVPKWLRSLTKDDCYSVDNYLFYYCANGGLGSVAMWLYSLNGVKISTIDELSFHYSCACGYLDAAKWWYDKSYTRETMYIAFQSSYANGHSDIAKWLIDNGAVPNNDHSLYDYYLSHI